MDKPLIDMHPLAILVRYAKLKKPLVYQQKMLEVIEIINRYGQHLPRCARRQAYESYKNANEAYYHIKCNCGWAEIMKELK